MSKSTDETKKGFRLSKGMIIVIAICAAAFAAALVLIGSFLSYAASYDAILPNIHIVPDSYMEGIAVGGMTEAEAEKAIQNAFADIAKGRSVKVICCGNERMVAFDDINLKIDSKMTANGAYRMGRESGDYKTNAVKGTFKKAVRMLGLKFKPINIMLCMELDREAVDKIIDEMAEGKEIVPTDTEYILDENKLIIFKAHNGNMVNRGSAAAHIEAAARNPKRTEVELRVEEVEAEMPDLEEFYKALTAPKKNAEYIFENGEIRIEPEKIGIKVEKSKVKEALASNQEQYELNVETEMPEVTAEELQKLLFRDTLGSFSSSFATSTAARASNVILTANRINGKILMPGDVFSYDQTIGKRTAANGYKEAGVYIGNKVESGIGGGICQTSSTLYSAVLYSNLEIVSRTSHSLPVSYIPLGQDATIAEGYIDFKFKNNTDYPIKIVAVVNGRRLTCSLVGVKAPNISVELTNTIISTSEPKTERTENAEIPQGYKRILNKGANGYTVASQRIVKESGKVIKTEQLTKSVYRAAPVEEEVNPVDKDTPTGNLKIYVPGMEVVEEKPETTTVPETSETETKPEETDTPPVEEPKTEENVEEIVNV